MLSRTSLKWIQTGVVLATLLGLFLIVAPVVGRTDSQAGLTIPYSGRLTGEEGKPVTDGEYAFTFSLYDTAEAGNLLWSEAQSGVNVYGGVFAVILGSVDPLPDAAKNGKLWLEVSVRAPQDHSASTLAPRQQLQPAASGSSTGLPAPLSPQGQVGTAAASSTCAHTHFGEGWSGDSYLVTGTLYGLHVTNTRNNGAGLRGDAPNGTEAWGVGGFSDDGVGVWGGTNTGTGVTGTSDGGRGVYGVSGNNDGVFGQTNLVGKSGVHGYSYHGYGVTGITYSTSTTIAAVQGINGGDGWGGWFVSDNYYGLYAKGNSADFAAYFENPNGASAPGLFVNGYGYVTGNLFVNGAKSGYVVDIAVNDGPESLETGDVVVLTGSADPLLGQIPLVRVRKAAQAGSKAVIGVVDQPLTAPPAQPGPVVQPPVAASSASALAAEGTAIGAGKYLSVVTLGSFKVIKVDASILPVHIGDLLVASAMPGYAMASDDPRLGSVIGKALGECKSGTCLIPLLVTLK